MSSAYIPWAATFSWGLSPSKEAVAGKRATSLHSPPLRGETSATSVPQIMGGHVFQEAVPFLRPPPIPARPEFSPLLVSMRPSEPKSRELTLVFLCFQEHPWNQTPGSHTRRRVTRDKKEGIM